MNFYAHSICFRGQWSRN